MATENTKYLTNKYLVRNSIPHDENITIGFHNTYIHNEQIDRLPQIYNDKNLDIIGVAEIGSEHFESFQSDNSYEYIERQEEPGKIRKVKNGILYSKNSPNEVTIELVKASQLYLDVSSIEYDAKVNYYGQDLNIKIITIHTTAPISKDYFTRRNAQLKSISNYLNKNNENLIKYDLVILNGDFNITPWSPFYRQFKQDLPKNWENVSTNNGLTATWRPHSIPSPINHFAQAHIDHMWVYQPENSSLNLCTNDIVFTRSEKGGSDHSLIYIEIRKSK